MNVWAYKNALEIGLSTSLTITQALQFHHIYGQGRIQLVRGPKLNYLWGPIFHC